MSTKTKSTKPSTKRATKPSTKPEQVAEQVGVDAPAKPKVATKVSGTGTWRDGRSTAQVSAWERWASEGSAWRGVRYGAMVDRLNEDERIERTDIGAEELLTDWANGGKGMTEDRIRKLYRERFPVEAPKVDEPAE